jgi:hypothetical protein
MAIGISGDGKMPQFSAADVRAVRRPSRREEAI